MNTRELELADQIEEAKSNGDHSLVSSLTKELIALQKTIVPVNTLDDDTLVRKLGVRRKHLDLERTLAKEMEDTKESGDYELYNEKYGKLKEVQAEQPGNVGVKLG